MIKSALAWLFYTIRSWWLHAATLGAWQRMGDYAFDLMERVDALEYRLDGLMRHLEESGVVIIPGHLEPQRATTFGEGLTVDEERKMVADSVLVAEVEEASGKCPACLGYGREPVGGYAPGAVLPTALVKMCLVCSGTGKVFLGQSLIGKNREAKRGEGSEVGSAQVPGGVSSESPPRGPSRGG